MAASSVPGHLEAHADRLRGRYLAFIHDLGGNARRGQAGCGAPGLGDGFSFWWMSLLAEKSPFKSPRISDCLRLLALEERLVARKPAALVFHGSDAYVARAIKELCISLRIGFSWKTLPLAREGRLRRWFHRLPHELQALVSLRHVALRWPLRRLQRPAWFSGSDAVADMFPLITSIPGPERAIPLPPVGVVAGRLHRKAGEPTGFQLFLFSSLIPTRSTGRDWVGRINRDPANNGKHFFLESARTLGIVARSLWKWLRLAAAAGGCGRSAARFSLRMFPRRVWRC